MGAHAVLAASAAKRWMTCPPSARLEEAMPKTTSEYAEEGRRAHALGEIKLRGMTGDHVPGLSEKFEALFPNGYDAELDECTTIYADYVFNNVFRGRPTVFIEEKVDLTEYIPAGFGTLDAGAIDEESLDIADYKHGKGVYVCVEENVQFMIYALGLLIRYGWIYSPKVVRMHVIQPRMDNVAMWEIETEKLLEWAENELRPAAQLAYMGAGEFVPGEHCGFCRAKGVCRARSENFTALEDFAERLPPLLSDAEIGELLPKLKPLEAWAKNVRAYALSACLTGDGIPGWKAVSGRSNRAFSDGTQAFQRLLDNEVPESLLYDRKPRTLAALEKDLGKKLFAEMVGDLIFKPEGAPTLVPESDSREAVHGLTAADEFADTEED